jgi:hypothetical protein
MGSVHVATAEQDGVSRLVDPWEREGQNVDKLPSWRVAVRHGEEHGGDLQSNGGQTDNGEAKKPRGRIAVGESWIERRGGGAGWFYFCW